MKHIEDGHGCEHWSTSDDRWLLTKTRSGLYRFPIAPVHWRDLPEFTVALDDAVFREQKRELEGEDDDNVD